MTPKPIPQFFWVWSRWMLGHAEFKDAGPKNFAHRPGPPVPAKGKIPQWAKDEYYRRFKPPASSPSTRKRPHDMWFGFSTWVNDPHNGSPAQELTALMKPQYDLVSIYLHSGASLLHDENYVLSWVNKMHANGLKVAGAGWGTVGDPKEHAVRDWNYVQRFRLDGWEMNGEKPVEGQWYSEMYVRHFRALSGPTFPLAWTTEPQLDLAHHIFQEFGVCYRPQAYPLENNRDVLSVVKTAVEVFKYRAEDVVPLVRATSPNDENTRYPAAEFYRQYGASKCGGLCLYPADANMGVPEYWKEMTGA